MIYFYSDAMIKHIAFLNNVRFEICLSPVYVSCNGFYVYDLIFHIHVKIDNNNLTPLFYCFPKST